MLSFVGSQRPLLIFLGVTTLIALATLAWAGADWFLDPLTAILAAATAVMACARLALGTPTAAARQTWLIAIALLALVGIGHLAGDRFTALGRWGVGFLPAAAAALLWLTGRFDPAPTAVRCVLWLGFAIQVAATSVTLASPEATSIPAVLTLISLELYLLGVTMIVSSVRRDLFVAQHRASEIGDFARYLFANSRLFRKVRHPRIGNYTVPGHKPVFVLVRFVTWFPTIAPRVRARCGIGLWRQFCDLWVMAIRHGLDAQVYYMFELYRTERRARTSGYLTRYEMKNGLYKVLTWQVSKSKRRIMLGDKLGMSRICKENGIPTVPILVVAEDGKLDYRCEPTVGLERDLFIKPRQSKGSRGIEVVRYGRGKYLCENGATLDRNGLVDLVTRMSIASPVLVQPLLKNHPGLADLADVALMRMRVITCLDQGGDPVITHAVLSNLCKLETGWPTDIEFGAAVDLDTGALGLMTGDKADAWLDWSENHPVTHARVLGRIVPCWQQMRSIALAAHSACRDRALVGWDIAVAEEGAVLLEGNSYPDVDFLQRAHRCAIGDSPLGPLLYARLADLERRVETGTLRGPNDYD